MAGAGLLFLTNLAAIVASAFVVFLLIGMRAPAMDREAELTHSQNRLVRTLLQGPVGNLVAAGGHLRWRVLMIVIVLGSLAVPLRQALMQVADETAARGAVQNELRRLAPAAAIVSQQVQIEPDRIGIRVISTQPIAGEKAAEVRGAIERQSGRTVDLSIDTVASTRDLAGILDRVRDTAIPPPPAARSLEEMNNELSAAIQPAIQEIWPSTDATLESVSVDLGNPDIALTVRYQASADLGPIPAEVILKSLRARLGARGLTVNLERVPRARAPSANGGKTPPVRSGHNEPELMALSAPVNVVFRLSYRRRKSASGKRIEGENTMKTIISLTAVLALAGVAFAQTAPATDASKAPAPAAKTTKKAKKRVKKATTAPAATSTSTAAPAAAAAPAAKK